jgi:hypothetical protein
MESFVETLCISCDGPVAKYLPMMQGGQSSNPGCYVLVKIAFFACGASLQGILYGILYS